MEENIVSAKIHVTITYEALFDFFLYHAYSKFSGFFQNILALAVFFLGVFSYVAGKINAWGCAMTVLASFIFLGYTPLILRQKAKSAIQEPEYKTPMDITFTDGYGILVEQGDNKRLYSWEKVLRASVTPKTIAIYVEPEKAVIIPKWDFGEKFVLCYQIIARGIGMSRSTSDK
ncbi:MAG: YcxB family protein [Synergistaceae bacterium]|nr:YcxB family protein [Synergistaceae bacterium]MBQ6435462.1 YcxB family protein [Synergistaceae bacterium]MBQ6737248.1 YcxB family protein [Synergistaceae bacterium]MBQ7068227.1 YcxB family protein [Synergistaceae bacterium]MBR0075556.1 YcxB family protein [Synergistaceae bacterium]